MVHFRKQKRVPIKAVLLIKMHKGPAVYGLIFPNAKMYVGKSEQYGIRMGQHKRAALRQFDGFWEKTTYVYNGIRKYKWENVHLYIFETYDENLPDLKKVLNEREMFYIAKYQTTDRTKGYNLTEGGEGNKGHKWTEEQLARITAIRNSPEWRLNCSKKQKKAWAREDVREKHRLAWEKPGAKEAHLKACIEAQNRPEVKAAARARMMGNTNALGNKLTDEQKKKIGDHFKGKKQSQDHINKRTAKIKIPVIATDGEGNETEYKSATDATKKLTEKYGKKFSRSHISACCRGERPTHRGMTFRLKDPESRKRKRKD